MTSESELRTFAEEIRSEIEDRSENQPEYPGHGPRDAFLAEIYTEFLCETGIISEPLFCPYGDEEGRGRCLVTGYELSEDGADLKLIVASSVAEVLQPFGKTDLSSITGRGARFFDYAVKGEFDRFRESQEATEAAHRIHGVRDIISTVRILVLTDGRATTRDIDSIEINELEIEFEVYDLERMLRISQTASSRDDIVVDFENLIGRPLPCLEVQSRPDEYETFITIFSGQLIYELYEKYGQRLFEYNVRSFLQARGKVNKGIRETLGKEPGRFLAYNNGLVATADDLEVGLYHGQTTIKRITGLQIVNGAQTTASIHRAKNVDKLDLSKVAVQVKITKVQPEKLLEFIPLISRFANTQNNIQVSDLSANHDFHIELERLASVSWCPGEETRWFYERARGAYQVERAKCGTPKQKRDFTNTTPPSKKITKTDLSKYLMAWMGRPFTVSFGAQKNFSIFMAELPEMFPEGWIPDEKFFRTCISKAIIYRAVEKIVRTEKFPAYRANISAYLVSYLAHIAEGELDFDLIWKMQEISEELADLLRTWSHVIDKAIRDTSEGRNITEWCKKPECWDHIRSLNPKLPTELPEEFYENGEEVEASGQEDGSPSDWSEEEKIEACMRFDAPGWARVYLWGVQSERLSRVERGVAHTLSEYAALGWKKRPSEKQARIGIRAIELAKRDDVLE